MIARLLIAVVLCGAASACTDPPPASPRPARSASRGLIGFIDTPATNSTVGPVFRVAGWAVGQDGVERVRIYLDDELMSTVPITAARPDIDRQFPRYAGTGPNHGFGTTIDAGARAGFRTLRIEAVDRHGATAHVAAANIKIQP